MAPDDTGDLTAIITTAPVLALSVPEGASGVVVGRAVALYGWSLRETTGAAAAQLDVYDGLGDGGQLVATVALAAGGSDALALSGPGVTCLRGLFVQAVSGSVAGSLWVAQFAA